MPADSRGEIPYEPIGRTDIVDVTPTEETASKVVVSDTGNEDGS